VGIFLSKHLNLIAYVVTLILAIISIIVVKFKDYDIEYDNTIQKTAEIFKDFKSESDLEEKICALKRIASSPFFRDKEKQSLCLTTIGLGYEKLAYGVSSSSGCDFLCVNGVISVLKVNSGDVLGKRNSGLSDSIVKCTDIANTEAWNKAREYYYKGVLVMNKLNYSEKHEDFQIKLMKAYRNAGYFFLCDYLKYRQDEYLDLSEECMNKAKQITESMPILSPRPHRDLLQKLLFINATRLQKNNLPLCE
jgi:hypothetical protein